MSYWLVFFVFLVICLTAIVVNSNYAIWESKRKDQVAYNFSEGDIIWSSKTKIFVITLVGFIGGLISAIVGVGGGIIFSPLLLSLDLHP